jgi:zinc protease
VKGVTMEAAEAALQIELEKIKKEKVGEQELQKVKNKTESLIAFEDMTIMNRANSLAFYELLGDAELMNSELDRYNKVTVDDILEQSRQIFREENSNTIWYRSNLNA